MKLNTLTNLILAAVATAGMTTAAFADDNARFEANLTVDSVHNCTMSVTAEHGTAMTATYKYTTADQAAGTFGTTTSDTVEPLTVLVTSGGPGVECPLGGFTVATSNPGIKIAKNTAGIPTHDGGVWPVRWVYTQFDAYDDDAGTTPATDATLVTTTNSLASAGYRSKTFSTNATDPFLTPPGDLWIIGTDANQKYGTYEGGRVPAILSHPGKLVISGTTNAAFPLNGTGLMPCAMDNDWPTYASNFVVTPPPSAASVRIGLAQLLATFPYATSTQAPDPLTVFDTVSGGGVPLTGTGTMTITAL